MEKWSFIFAICLFTVSCSGQTFKDPLGENDLNGSDITSTVKGASSEQKQNYGPGNTTITKDKRVVQFETIEEDKILTVPLHCSSNCNPPCLINWIKDGKLLSDETNEVFNMPRNRTMSGNYTCRATGEEGTETSKPVTVTVTYSPGRVLISPDKDIFFTKRGGTPKEDVVCMADCLPQCSYKWYYASSPQRSGYLWTMGNTLFASRRFTYTSHPYYYCEARNDHGSSSSNWIKIDVQDGPEKVTITAPQAPVENSTFSLHCSANCLHGCESYLWLDGSRREIKNADSLTFNNLNRSDNGKYTCFVEDYFGRNSITYNLKVQYGPRIVNIDYTADGGELWEGRGYITIRCHADCYPPCDRYLIYHNNILKDTSKEIKITKTRENSGRYNCSASNSGGRGYTQSSNVANIIIKYGPRNVSIEYTADHGHLWEGRGTITIRCNADCYPPCDRYLIYHNNTLKNTSKEIKITKTRENSGRYFCSASNSVRRGNVKSSANVDITVKYQTVILEANKRNVSLRVNSYLPNNAICKIECNFDNCQSDIEVRKDSEHYRTISKSFQSIFNRRKARIDDSGTYFCRLRGRNSQSDFTLNVLYGPRGTRISESNQLQEIRYKTVRESKNEIVSLRCSSNCNPPCGIDWYKDGTLLPGERKEIVNIPRNRKDSGYYMCRANGEEGSQNSTNTVKVTVEYIPEIAFTDLGNHKHITAHAPGTFNLTYSIDSFPPSNVSVFHNTINLMEISNVTGQHIFTTPITSCRDEGEYILEAVNEVGSVRAYVILNLTCSPIYISFPNKSDSGFSIGDRVVLNVTFKGNPAAEVSWMFNPWNSNISRDVPFHRIQNQSKYHTALVIETMSMKNFGTYKLQLKNIHGSISKDFIIEGPSPVSTEIKEASSLTASQVGLSQDTDLSPTSRRGRLTNIREMELKNLMLEHRKLEEEIQKLQEERKVLELKQQYYNIRLKEILKGTKK
uniref:Hemicentin-1-like isoform X1 n=1 Tax=Crassostrea virginica TaxID=6565 RepID=A0A8B8D006_CRAVI|nr:hemicentin-1-like isoform X1 [Crassostrea virginica]